MAVENIVIWLFSVLGWVSKELNYRQRYILDTFPVAVCHNIRIKNCRLLTGEDFRKKVPQKESISMVLEIFLKFFKVV